MRKYTGSVDTPPRSQPGRIIEINQLAAQQAIGDMPPGRQRVQHFHCTACGFAANAERVGAINILRAGRARCACEVSEAARQLQEPTEATQERLRAA